MEHTTNFIAPFEKRTFSERFRAVLMFMKQNFLPVLKYDLLVFIIISLLVSWIITATGKSINNIGSLINFVCFSYFTHYILNQGNMSAVSFKEMLKTTGKAFLNVFFAGLLLLVIFILPLLILVAVTVLVIMPIVTEMVSNEMFAFIISMIPFMLVVFYLLPIILVYYNYNYFSSSENKGIALVESYRLVKGHWWSTFGFMVLFEVMGGIVGVLMILLVHLLFDSFLSSYLCEVVDNIILFVIVFFSSHVAMVYQYGHLVVLKEEREKETANEPDR